MWALAHHAVGMELRVVPTWWTHSSTSFLDGMRSWSLPKLASLPIAAWSHEKMTCELDASWATMDDGRHLLDEGPSWQSWPLHRRHLDLERTESFSWWWESGGRQVLVVETSWCCEWWILFSVGLELVLFRFAILQFVRVVFGFVSWSVLFCGQNLMPSHSWPASFQQKHLSMRF